MAGNNLKIAVGTTSELKLRAVIHAFGRAGINVEVIGFKVDSGVEKQPFGFDEIKFGACTRAKNALTQDPRADYGLGIESGIIEEEPTQYFDVACCIIVNYAGNRVGKSYSAAIEIPQNVVRIIKGEGLDAGEVAQRLGGIKEKDPTLWLSGGRLSRDKTIEEAVFLALTKEFLNPSAYQ